MYSYKEHLVQSKAEANLIVLKNSTLNERKAAIIKAEMNLYHHAEYRLLMQWYKDKNDLLTCELESIFNNIQFLLLFLEYMRLEKLMMEEKKNTPKKNLASLNHFIRLIGNINLLSILGLFSANVLHLLGVLLTTISTAVAYIGALVILACAVPVSLSTMIIATGVEFINAVLKSKTPQRSVILITDVTIISCAVSAFMIPLGVIPATMLGFPIVLPLLFTGIAMASYYKDYKRLIFKNNQLAINNRIVEHHEVLLENHIKTLSLNGNIVFEDPRVQRLSLVIAEATRENEIIKIEEKTLRSLRHTHEIALGAIAILVISAFVFPPLSLGGAIIGVVGMGIFLGTNLYSKQLRNNEKILIHEKEQETPIGSIQNITINNALKKAEARTDRKLDGYLQKNFPNTLENEHQPDEHKKFHPGKMFYHENGFTNISTDKETTNKKLLY